jgi:hypothetical protein
MLSLNRPGQTLILVKKIEKNEGRHNLYLSHWLVAKYKILCFPNQTYRRYWAQSEALNENR